MKIINGRLELGDLKTEWKDTENKKKNHLFLILRLGILISGLEASLGFDFFYTCRIPDILVDVFHSSVGDCDEPILSVYNQDK